MEGGGMRHKFPPRFDGPGEFFRGPPGPMGPPGMYDDGAHQRHRRYDDRRRHNRQDFDVDKERETRPERNSRWSSGSPPRQDNVVSVEEGCDDNKEEKSSEPVEEAADKSGGNTTPLRDEPQEPQQQGEVVSAVEQELTTTEEANTEQ